MIRSMTGFGKAICELEDKVVTIEVKSLNSKQLDLFTRLPALYREKDMEIRNLLSQKLNRGKIELNITFESANQVNSAQINIPLVKSYYDQLKNLAGELGINSTEQILPTIMRFPEALKTAKEEFNETEWVHIEQKINLAINDVDQFREREGNALKIDIIERVDGIKEMLNQIAPFEEDRVNKIREKINNSLSELKDKDKLDANRLEQELIYYLEKLDITEEKVRLLNHCHFFIEVIDSENFSGKKLGFIAQEMGREINTIGSKANNSEIQRLVVQMKDELEKVKEQLMNVL